MAKSLSDLVELIAELAENGASFQSRGESLADFVDSLSEEDVLEHLLQGGVIPESLEHDSTEEKLFAKYCDLIISRGFSLLGFDSRAVDTRGDSADVEASAKSYTLVADAKAFRLSRTAKNQKDFKVESLNQWKTGFDFAVLVGPLFQYPSTNSQIYSQAIRYNVTLLSYAHLVLAIRTGIKSPESLRPVFETPGTINESKSATEYWTKIDAVYLSCIQRSEADWESIAKERQLYLRQQAEIEASFWEEYKRQIRSMEHDQAVEALIKALKLDAKIRTIRKYST